MPFGKHEIRNGDMVALVALGLGAAALFLALARRDTTAGAPPGLSREQTQAMIDAAVATASTQLRKDIQAETAQLRAGSDKVRDEATAAAVRALTDTRLEGRGGPAGDRELRRMVEQEMTAQVREKLAEKLERMDWDAALPKERVLKELRRAVGAELAFDPVTSRVDLAGADTPQAKVDKILAEFEGVRSYTHNNPLVQQLAGLGDEAIQPLLDRLSKTGHEDWAVRMAAAEALGNLLTADHRDIILKAYQETGEGTLAKLIAKYNIQEGEDEIMRRLREPQGDQVVDAALAMNAERAVPILLEMLKNGEYNQGMIAQKLASLPWVELEAPLREAASHAKSLWDKQQLADCALKRGMPEGLELAVEVLRSQEDHSEYAKTQVLSAVRSCTAFTGSAEQTATWLAQNRGNLVWNPEARLFELK